MNAPRPGSRVNLQVLSRAAKTSVSTVSRALHNNPEVSAETCERIQSLAREMGYEPNAMGAGLAHLKRTSRVRPVHASLAWLNWWPDPKELHGYPLFRGYWRGASVAASKFGYRLEEFPVNESTPPRRVQEILLARGIHGILLPPHGALGRNWREFDWSKFSVVRLGLTVAMDFHTVTADAVANAMFAFRRIREKGYRRIGLVAMNVSEHYTCGAGFLWAQATSRQESSAIPPFLFSESTPSCQRSFQSWLRTNKPDAILTDKKETAGMLKKAGYRVPEDIGYVVMCVPDCGNAGIDQNAEEIGQVSVVVVVSLLNDQDRGLPPVPRSITVPGIWTDGPSLPDR